MQVDEIGGGDLCEMADFRGTSPVEMEGWVAQERVYGVLWGATCLQGGDWFVENVEEELDSPNESPSRLKPRGSSIPQIDRWWLLFFPKRPSLWVS